MNRSSKGHASVRLAAYQAASKSGVTNIMRLAVSDCLDGLRRRIRSGNWLTLVEMLALALLVLQGARLLWAVVTPIGSYGAWEGRQAQIPEAAARQVLFATFDPFFRAGQPASEIGRAHVCTPVTNAHLVC